MKTLIICCALAVYCFLFILVGQQPASEEARSDRRFFLLGLVAQLILLGVVCYFVLLGIERLAIF